MEESPSLFQRVAGGASESVWLPIGVLALAALGMRSKGLVARTKAAAWRLLKKVPAIGRLYSAVRAHRLLDTMALMLESGALISTVLTILSTSTSDQREAEKLRTALEDIKNGEDLVTALRCTELFPPVTISLMTAGYEAGRLPEMVRRAATICQEEVSYTLATFLQLIEPLTMMIVGILSGFLILNLALPMLSVLRNL